MVAITVTALICLTFLICNHFGFGVRITYDHNHTFKDTTERIMDDPKDLSELNIKKMINDKDKDPKEVEDFVTGTINTLQDYIGGKDEDDG